MDDDQHSTLSDTTCATKKNENRPSHDASIFVGSLPSNVDQGDLSRMLMDHLSEHTQIKNIKVVRDSKGGVCAFVQCLDANSATSLIETLYANPPRLFLGRTLRYEPARAFRTLIISYRTPIHLNHSSGSSKDQSTEMELPAAMRIWKHHNSKFHSILYDAQALQAEENQSRSGPSESEVVFLHPVKYDEESLRDLAAYFGSLESFNPIEVPADGQYPIPHNGPRYSTMDSRCWEVKWRHRDECVSALMTLRRVPHLTVTWAHQPLSRSPLSPHYVSRTPSFPFRFQHQHHEPPGFGSPDVLAHPTGRHLYPDYSNCQFIRQKYGPHATMGRGTVHSSRALANKQGLNEDLNTMSPKSLLQHRQDQGFVSLSSDQEAMPKGSETQDHEPLSSTDLDAQDVSVPPTPSLDASSITPGTPGAHFPVTPATSRTSYDEFAIKGDPMEYSAEKHVDPTTLFVGGLDISGPGAWDEEKVRTIFCRYGGLESIKFVRPINATVAFAFVKFNNLEAPARAVQEEHNRVYEGRALRVHLRDMNPPKVHLKFGRGRGRFPQHNFNSNRRYNYRPFIHGQDNPTVATHEGGPGYSPETNAGHCSVASIPETLHQRKGSTLSTPVGREAPGADRFREWYDGLESPHTPAPSSKDSSTSVTCASYNTPSYPLMHNAPYMHPPWMQPYVPNGSHPLPYYPGYTLYPPQPPPMMTPPGPDTTGSAIGPVAVWPSGVYGSFVSYPIGPLRVPTVGQAGQTHGPSQPPLIPTGFMQNEHGALIAVYQPEALSRYMASSGEAPNVSHQEARPYHSEGAQPQTAPHHISHHQGQTGGAFNTAPFNRVPGVQSSQIPYHEGMNASFDNPHRRPHQAYQNYNNNIARNNQPGNIGTFPRPYAGRPGRGYLQTTATPQHGCGGQGGRRFGDWNR